MYRSFRPPLAQTRSSSILRRDSLSTKLPCRRLLTLQAHFQQQTNCKRFFGEHIIIKIVQDSTLCTGKATLASNERAQEHFWHACKRVHCREEHLKRQTTASNGGSFLQTHSLPAAWLHIRTICISAISVVTSRDAMSCDSLHWIGAREGKSL